METQHTPSQTINETEDYTPDHDLDVVENISEGLEQFEPEEHQFEENKEDVILSVLKGGNQSRSSTPKARIQPKLIIGQPNDPYEREADRMADLVMGNISNNSSKLKRKSGKPIIHQKGTNPHQATYAPDGIAQKLGQKKGGGAPLPSHTKIQMEQGFGVDFSTVRVHTDGDAVKMNQQLGARAFTYGSDVYFNRGEFSPASKEGQRLLAHELTHVVQQELIDNFIQRFEAPIHESSDRYGLTRDHLGGSSGLTNEEASNVYFGNWMRDVNQAFVPTLTNSFDIEFIFALLNYVAAQKFGRLLTPEMLGYYIPAEHIDNPAGLVSQDDLLPQQPNISPSAILNPDNSQVRSTPFITPQEDVTSNALTIQGSRAQLFDIDQTGTIAFIRRSNIHVEKRLELAVTLGRNPDGMLHLGAALHTIEDLFAHSNWIEIAVEKVLQDNPNLLEDLSDDDRKVFNFSRNVSLSSNNIVKERPILTTGTFTGADTAISLISEVVNILKRPIPPPSTEEEEKAQENFITSLLSNFESKLESDSKFRASLGKELSNRGLPPLILDIPITQLYHIQKLLSLPFQLPDFIPEFIREFIRGYIQSLMEEVANRIQAEALTVNVADTSLINFLNQQREMAAGNSQIQPSFAETLNEELTGTTIRDQRRAARPSARRHLDALQNTPEYVVAGPSHSQLAKDHNNSPFFGIAFTLSTHAVRRIRNKILSAWNSLNSSHNRPFIFEWDSYPNSENDRDLYHSNRRERERLSNESLERGRGIIYQGGDSELGHDFQPYSIQNMRMESSTRIRMIATVLNNLANNPQNADRTLTTLRQNLQGSSLPEGTLRILQDRIGNQLDDISNTLNSDSPTNVVAELRSIASDLNQISLAIEQARTLDSRERLNKRLTRNRDNLLVILAKSSIGLSNLRAAIIILLNDEISRTAVSYSTRQRRILNSNVEVFSEHTGRRNPRVQNINLPSLEDKSRAIQELIQESRLILNHPYESNWWVSHIIEYIRRNPQQVMADIEARNTGYAVFRKMGNSNSTHHHP